MAMKKLELEKPPGRTISKLFIVVFSIFVAIVFFCIGIGIGYLIKQKSDNDENARSENITAEIQRKRFNHHPKLLESMEADNIRDNLKEFTSLPHYPGSDQNYDLAKKLKKVWVEQGFDEAKLYKYNIYLSYPQSPGEITLNGGANVKLVIENEPPFDDSEKKGKVLWPFNAFAAKKTVNGELVFVNYCRDSDFEAVIKAGVNVTGKIAICKYGKGSRTMKTVYSEKRGLVGLIIFTDPWDHTYPGQEYPHGWMLNKYGVQRGTVNRLPGDALSLGHPSKDNYFRYSEDKYSGNPVIPVQPISYGTAYTILSWMNDTSIPLPKGFGGGLNFTYPLQSGKDRTIKLKVDTKLETKATYTICAKLYGKEEPDRYVMLGNHRDAWTYGASDPSSGTATMMEIVRALGEYKKKHGWRPRRSIMACSWGAEESGIQGSTEWADDHHKFLKEQVTMYLNVDMAVEGNFTVRLKTIDSMVDATFDAAKIIQAPDDPSKTLYEDWYEKSLLWQNKTTNEMKEPYYSLLTSGSDYKALWHCYGTPSADFRYYFSRIDFPKLPQNGHYHTMYESFGWMSKFVDPGFIHHLAIGRLWAGHLLIAANAHLIPYNVFKYSKQVKAYLEKFETTYKTLLDKHGVSMSFAKERMEALVTKSEKFQEKVKQIMGQPISPLTLRRINDKIMNFERSFIMEGVSSNPVTRHTVYATTYYKLYNERFPGISEAIFYAVKKNSTDWDDVKKQITYLVWCIDTAIMSLDLEQY